MKEGIKYLLWLLLFVASLLVLQIDGITRTKHIGVSIPIEVVVIFLASFLLLSSKLISNQLFSLLNWLILLFSTVPLVTFLLLVTIGSPGNFILAAIIYTIGFWAITRWKNPNKTLKQGRGKEPRPLA